MFLIILVSIGVVIATVATIGALITIYEDIFPKRSTKFHIRESFV